MESVPHSTPRFSTPQNHPDGLLDLNETERVNFRDQVNGSIRYLERVERQLQGTLREIEQRIAADPAALAGVSQEREALQNDLSQVQRYLTNLSGNS